MKKTNNIKTAKRSSAPRSNGNVVIQRKDSEPFFTDEMLEHFVKHAYPVFKKLAQE